jgi:hypothetical protein
MKPMSQAIPMTSAAELRSIAPKTRTTRVRVRAGFGTVGELYRTLVENGRWWMFPMIGILGVTSLLLIAIAAIEYVAPFVYTIF